MPQLLEVHLNKDNTFDDESGVLFREVENEWDDGRSDLGFKVILYRGFQPKIVSIAVYTNAS